MTPRARPTSPPERPDSDARERLIVASIRAGNSSAWGQLLTMYQDRLYAVCFRMVHDRELAADLTQDSMIRIIEGIASYDGRSKFSTWVFRVAMNVCLSRLRSEKLRRHASLDAMRDDGREPSAASHHPRAAGAYRTTPYQTGSDEREPEGEQAVQREEERLRLAAALLDVSAEQRAILILRDSRGLDYDQIAEVLDIPVGTVKSRIFRAREALREALERRMSRG